MKKLLAILLTLTLVLLTGCAASPAAKEEPTAAPTEAPTAEPTAEPTEEPAEEETAADTPALPTAQTYPVATITMMDGGVITLELYPKLAPNTVANFIELANSGFYDGLIFHRVISGFMIQGGCPYGTGTGNPGYTIAGEFSANAYKGNILQHKRGVISMARSQMPDSAGSQFFIMHQDASHLDGQYAAFGKVTSGMEVVDAIAAVQTNASDKPLEDQVIKTIRVETWGVEYEVEKIEN